MSEHTEFQQEGQIQPQASLGGCRTCLQWTGFRVVCAAPLFCLQGV